MSSHGGPRIGSGHEPEEFARCKYIRVGVTETELDILTQLAAQWGVPVATATYGLILDRINECRGGMSDASTGINVVVRAASRIVMEAARRRQQDDGRG